MYTIYYIPLQYGPLYHPHVGFSSEATEAAGSKWNVAKAHVLGEKTKRDGSVQFKKLG